MVRVTIPAEIKTHEKLNFVIRLRLTAITAAIICKMQDITKKIL